MSHVAVVGVTNKQHSSWSHSWQTEHCIHSSPANDSVQSLYNTLGIVSHCPRFLQKLRQAWQLYFFSHIFCWIGGFYCQLVLLRRLWMFIFLVTDIVYQRQSIRQTCHNLGLLRSLCLLLWDGWHFLNVGEADIGWSCWKFMHSWWDQSSHRWLCTWNCFMVTEGGNCVGGCWWLTVDWSSDQLAQSVFLL